MPTYKRTKMCSECPFRANAPRGWLGPLAVDDLEDAVHGPRIAGTNLHYGDIGVLICHKEIDKLKRRGRNPSQIAAEGQQCVGMLRYANACLKDSRVREVSDFQTKLLDVPDQPVIPAGKLREHHTLES
jgi:hypothetical protein